MSRHGWFWALAACAISGVAAAAATDFPVGPQLPPRMVRAAGGYDDCQVTIGQQLGQEEKVSARLTVAADGSLSKISLPESAPAWQAELVACVLRRTEFRSAQRDGGALQSLAILPITFAAGAAGERMVRVVKVGPLITPPLIVRDNRGPLGCHPVGVELTTADERHLVMVTILPDGNAAELKLPAGGPEWLEGSARCVLSQVSFVAGTLDGLPVASEATLPIVFNDAGRSSKPEFRITAPTLASTEEEVEMAYRACYPADLQARVRVQFRFSIGAGGHVRNPELVVSSGDAQVDEVAHCVLGRLRFTPMLRGASRVASTVTWPLWVRPPQAP